jgi:hypothetical protein
VSTCADADLYLALWHEASGNEVAAVKAMERAVASPYGPASKDYMWHLALVHTALRGWAGEPDSVDEGKLREEL